MSRLLAACLLAAALPVQAEVYKWVDAKGQVNYSNTPPPTAANSMQPVDERISVMGMDPAVRAAAERRFAALEAQEERDWQRRQQAMLARPAPQPAPALSYSDSYASSYYPPYYYAGSYYAPGARRHPHHFRPKVSHYQFTGPRVSHHARGARIVARR